MEQEIDLGTYGNLPRLVREKLATANGQPSTQGEIDKEQKPVEPEQLQQIVIEQTEQVEGAQATPETPKPQEESNDIKSWKGRLSKEQEAHTETKNRYLVELEARQKAEKEAREAREKLAAIEQANALPQTPPKSKQPIEKFSDEELEDMKITMGASGEKLARFISQYQANTEEHTTDVTKVIEERLAQERQHNEEQRKAEAFIKAVQEQAPKLQGLINNSAFVEFANREVVDFAGNTAASMLNFIAVNKRVDLVPKITDLIEKFEQSQQPPIQQITAPPSNNSVAVVRKNVSGKKKPTPDVLRQIKYLMNTGQVDKLRELQEQYDLD